VPKTSSNVTLLSRKSEHLVLSGPFGRRVYEASNSHSAWQPAFDRSIDEIRGDECERDCHIDFSDGTPLARGNIFDSDACIIDQLFEPTAPARWRMLLAADKLENSSDPISIIAFSLGYESESAFSTAFKRVMGCSPRQFSRASKPDSQPQGAEMSRANRGLARADDHESPVAF
jgi:hypothetical protein